MLLTATPNTFPCDDYERQTRTIKYAMALNTCSNNYISRWNFIHAVQLIIIHFCSKCSLIDLHATFISLFYFFLRFFHFPQHVIHFVLIILFGFFTAFLPHMVQRKSGHIVFISSIAGKVPIPFRSSFAASKHALQAFSDAMRAELSIHNIKVMVSSPEYISNDVQLDDIEIATGENQNENQNENEKPGTHRILYCDH